MKGKNSEPPEQLHKQLQRKPKHVLQKGLQLKETRTDLGSGPSSLLLVCHMTLAVISQQRKLRPSWEQFDLSHSRYIYGVNLGPCTTTCLCIVLIVPASSLPPISQCQFILFKKKLPTTPLRLHHTSLQLTCMPSFWQAPRAHPLKMILPATEKYTHAPQLSWCFQVTA